MSRRARAVLAAALLALPLASCAYYNTYYLARRYYLKGTEGEPYVLDRNASAQSQNFTRSVEYSKKLLSSYPKSKWVDDAYLLWAKSLLGRDDPLQTINMLQDFTVRYPHSPIRPEATFFLGVAYRHARKYSQAVSALDSFLVLDPRNDLAPYAHLERSRALTSLQRYGDAAEAAGRILAEFPKSSLKEPAQLARAEARIQQGDYQGARADFHDIGQRALSDEERFSYLLREADCLEAGRLYDEELALLRGALAHEAPPGPPTPGVLPPAGADHYGRLTMRIGTALMLSGQFKESLDQYANVIKDYPKTALAAEAQYRVGYAYETSADDFDRARIEYGKVKEQFGQSAFNQQSQQRLADLDRIAQFRKGTGADSLEKQAEAGFLTAELYLLQQNRPERALEEYRQIAARYPGTEIAGRAINAQAWVLSHKLEKPAESDSLLWKVVHEYPATEAQMAARDYLEARGAIVPDSLIVPPAPKAPVIDTTTVLTPPPETVPPLGGLPARPPGLADTLGAPTNTLIDRMRRLRNIDEYTPGAPRPPGVPPPGTVPSPPDTSVAIGPPVPVMTEGSTPRDSTRTSAPRDTTRAPAAPDTTRSGRR